MSLIDVTPGLGPPLMWASGISTLARLALLGIATTGGSAIAVAFGLRRRARSRP